MDGWGVRYRGVGPLDFSEGKGVLLMVGVFTSEIIVHSS